MQCWNAAPALPKKEKHIQKLYLPNEITVCWQREKLDHGFLCLQKKFSARTSKENATSNTLQQQKGHQQCPSSIASSVAGQQ